MTAAKKFPLRKHQLSTLLELFKQRLHQVNILGGEHEASPYRHERQFLLDCIDIIEPQPTYVMCPSAGGATREQMHAVGWTDELLLKHGHMEIAK